MRSPWPVIQRDRVSPVPDAQPDSATVEDGVAAVNLELFSKTRTSWIVPVSASVMIDKL